MEEASDSFNSGFTLGDWTVNPIAGTVSRGDRSTRLEPRVMEVLVVLAEHSGELVPKTELLDRVWPDAIVEEGSLTRCISDARRSLDDDPRAPRYIQTIHRRGYRLLVWPEALPPAAARRKRRARSWPVWAPVVAAVFLGAGIPIVLTTAAPGSGRSSRPTVAVMEFGNLSDEAGSDYFAAGLTDDITTNLSKLNDLRVIARTATRRIREGGKDVHETSQELGIDAILEGSVRREGRKVRITGRLIDTQTDEHLWAETYDRELEDVFDVQADVAKKIAWALESEMRAIELRNLEKPPTVSFAAYDLYLRGREAYLRYRRDENENAILFFQEAIDADPGFGLAYAGLASAYSLRVTLYGYDDSSGELALQAGARAVRLAPDRAEAFKAMGMALGSVGRYREALGHCLDAVKRQPSYPAAIWCVADNSFVIGDLEQAITWQRRYLELCSDPQAWTFMALYLTEIGLTQEAAVWLEKALSEAPNDVWALGMTAYLKSLEDDVETARELATQMLKVHPNDYWAVLLNGELELRAGHHERARELFTKGIELADDRTPVFELRCRLRVASLELTRGESSSADNDLELISEMAKAAIAAGDRNPRHRWTLAAVAAARGHHEQALRWYRASLELGHRMLRWDLNDPLFMALPNNGDFRREIESVLREVEEMRRSVEGAEWFADLAEGRIIPSSGRK